MQRSKHFISRHTLPKYSLLQFIYSSLTEAVPVELELQSFNSSKLRLVKPKPEPPLWPEPYLRQRTHGHQDKDHHTHPYILSERRHHLATLGLH